MNILSSSSESCPEYPTESIIYQLLHRCPMKNQPQRHYLLPLTNGERAGEWERRGRNKCKRCVSLLKLLPNTSKTRACAPQNPRTIISSVARMQRWTLSTPRKRAILRACLYFSWVSPTRDSKRPSEYQSNQQTLSESFSSANFQQTSQLASGLIQRYTAWVNWALWLVSGAPLLVKGMPISSFTS